MQNITLINNTRECIIENNNKFLGYIGENDVNKLVFKFADGFKDGIGILNIERGNEIGYVSLDKVGETYEFPVKNSILTQVGDIKFQVVITGYDGSVIKYDIFIMTVNDAIDADSEMPEDYPTWVDMANAKLAEVDEAIENANKLSAKIEQTETGALITITDKDGTTEAEIYHGSGDGTGAAGGTNNYNSLINKPKINGVELTDNKTLENLGIKQNYNKTDVGLDKVDNVRQYSNENPPPYPVKSVNGKTGNVVIEIPTVPTKLSELENDKGYIIDYTETDPTVPNHVKTIKESDISNWNNKSEFSGDYNDLSNKPEGLATTDYVDNAISTAIGGALNGTY